MDVDFYVRFVGETTVVYTLDIDPQSPDHAPTATNQRILSNATDALGHKITAIALNAPDFKQVKTTVEARNGWSSGQSYFNRTGFAAG